MKHLLIICLLVLLISCNHIEQKAELKTFERSFQLDDTSYELPYTLPTEEGIIGVLESIYQHISSSTSYSVINKNTYDEITDFSIPDSTAVVDTRKGTFNLWDYTAGVIHTGMFAVGSTLSDQRYTDYPIANYDFIVKHQSYFREKARLYGLDRGAYHRLIDMHALDHCGSIGAALVEAYGYNPDTAYRALIDTVENYILHEQFRLEDGTLARQRPQEASVWADDFYMCIPFLSRMAVLSDNLIYFDDAIRQVLQMSSYLFNWDLGLFDHGWNSCSGDYDPRYYWGRANGWAMMATVTLLDLLPEAYPGRDSVLSIYRMHVKGIAEHQGKNGLWHNLLNRFDSYPETSSTSMFVYGIAKGVNEGWIDQTYGAVAQAGWNGLTMYITKDGKIENMCAGTTFSPDLVYYYHRPPSHNSMHAYGSSLLAGSEMIKLLRNDEIEIIKQWRTYHYKAK